MYEHKKQPLASKPVYYRRVVKNLLVGMAVLVVAILIGTIGFRTTCPGIRWLDAFHNASMLLSGMGPVLDHLCDEGIWFSSLYALFSGVVFITNIGFILAPVIHRFFHKLHLEQ